MTSYRQVGGRLGAYIRSQKPTAPQIQGLLSDLLAGDEVLVPMRDLTQRQSFNNLIPLIGTGSGIPQRQAILAEIGNLYTRDILNYVAQILDGMLDLPASQSAVGLNKSKAQSAPKPHRPVEPPQKLSDRASKTDSRRLPSFVKPLIATAAVVTASSLTAFVVTKIPASSDKSITPQSTTAAISKTSLSGEVGYPSDYIPALTICAVETTTKSKVCRNMPEAPSTYQYDLEVPEGKYNVYYEVLRDKETFGYNSFKQWSGFCEPSRDGGCAKFYVSEYTAAPGVKSITANLDSNAGREIDGEASTQLIF